MVTLTLVEDRAVIILTVVVLASWKLIPPLLARVEKTCNDEISLLLTLTICLTIAAIMEMVGLSLALGAFVGGLILGNSAYAHKLAAKTFPIRDAFVALFFVTIGMIIGPWTWPSSWR